MHPITKKPLFVQDGNDEEKMLRMKSSEVCYIMIIADTHDKKWCLKKDFMNFISGEIEYESLDSQNQMVNLLCVLFASPVW